MAHSLRVHITVMVHAKRIISFLLERSRWVLTTLTLTLSDLEGQGHLPRSNLQNYPKWLFNITEVLLNTKKSFGLMQIEQVFEMCRSNTIEAEQHAKLFQALRTTANTGSVGHSACFGY